MKKKNNVNLKKVVNEKIYNSSPIISEVYPFVSSISIKKTFYDESGANQIGNTKIWDIPIENMRMYLNIDCLRSCVDGGFNLTDEIIQMIDKRETQRKNKLVCQGWQDEERAGKYHCFTTLLYEIEINY